jgi:hypothetical protein
MCSEYSEPLMKLRDSWAFFQGMNYNHSVESVGVLYQCAGSYRLETKGTDVSGFLKDMKVTF